ncbi:MAG TPA: methyltransferase dimerization domain-containing protein, partial [Pseudonocardia sp.]|nr:methyltransferase dimerization domain-containing protein [Pseudonocardia sp.]
MGQADAAELRRLAGLATPMTLRVAVTLGLPDRLRERAATAAELAAELAVSPIALDLLLEHLASLEVVARTSAGYRTTAYGTNLCA